MNVVVLSISLHAISESLKIADRPLELTKAIETGFKKAQSSRYGWYGQSKEDYGSNAVFFESRKLIEELIKAAPAAQKNFYVVDIGAGYGGYLDGLGEYIEKTELSSDINIHLIGLTAQKDVPYKQQQVGRNCTKYLFGNFNIENFNQNLDELSRNGLDIKGKIDITVTHFTFIHLIDPLGTLMEIYNNLKSGMGMMYIDYFAVNLARDTASPFESTSLANIPIQN